MYSARPISTSNSGSIDENATNTLHSTMDSEKKLSNSATTPPLDSAEDAENQLETLEAGLKTSWTSVAMACGMALISAIQFTLYFTSLWPFMKVLDDTTTEFFFGIVIAVYSLAQIISAPLFGYWSNRAHQLRWPLITCSLFMIVGNVLYALVEIFPSRHNYWLMLARFITGVGASNIGLLKAYASVASTMRDRRKAMAFVTGGNAMGLTVGPALQFAFTHLGFEGFRLTSSFHIGMFTAPAWLATLLNMLVVVLMVFYFKENFVGVLDAKAQKAMSKRKQKKTRKQQTAPSATVGWYNPSSESDEGREDGSFTTDCNGHASCSAMPQTNTPISAPSPPTVVLPKYDKLAAAVCYAIRFTQMFVFTNIETIGSSFEMMMFAFNVTEVVKYSSYAHMARGVVTLGVYILYIFTRLGQKVNDRLVCLISLVGLLLYHAFTFPWPFISAHVTEFNSTMRDTDPEHAVGCNRDEYAWCDSLTQVNMWIYYILMTLLVGISFSNINVTMNTIFSRVIGPRMQGTQQGILQMTEGTARMFGPLLVGFIYSRYGPRLVWILESVVIITMAVIWAAAYHRLVPLKIPVLPAADMKQREADLISVPSKAIMSPMELFGLSRMNQHIFDEPSSNEDENGGLERVRSRSEPTFAFAPRTRRIFTINS